MLPLKNESFDAPWQPASSPSQRFKLEDADLPAYAT